MEGNINELVDTLLSKAERTAHRLVKDFIVEIEFDLTRQIHSERRTFLKKKKDFFDERYAKFAPAYTVHREGKLRAIVRAVYDNTELPNEDHNDFDSHMTNDEKLRQLISEKWVLHKKIMHLKELIDSMDEHSTDTNLPDPIKLDKTRHKVVLLHELKIIQNLLNEFPVLKDDKKTMLSKLIATIIGEPETIGTIRKELSYIDIPEHPKSPLTKTALKTVHGELLKIGFELNE